MIQERNDNDKKAGIQQQNVSQPDSSTEKEQEQTAIEQDAALEQQRKEAMTERD